MKISVIIPTYNEEDVIEGCIGSLMKQSLADFEIIIVDDGSGDNTLNLLGVAEAKNSRLLVLRQLHKGPGAARNLGADKAKGEILVFVDADMTFDKNFLKNLTKPIASKKTKGTFSKYEYVSNWDNPWARCWNINENWEDRRRHPRNYPDKEKVFRAIKKSEFDRVGGFTPGDYTDDYSLSAKLGYLADAAPSAIFYHENPSTLREIYKQARWIGKRKYKLGNLGYLVALVRASFPVSLGLGLIKALLKREPSFIVFKIVYDLGIEMGILSVFLGKSKTK